MSGRVASARRRGIDRLAACAGIVGAGAIGIGSVVTAIVYRGADGEPYSPLNHFVSELGELAQSELAGVFNAGLMVGGICFAVFMSGLAASRPGSLRLLAGGMTETEILSEYPDLQTEDIRECLRFAAAAAMEREMPLLHSA